MQNQPFHFSPSSALRAFLSVAGLSALCLNQAEAAAPQLPSIQPLAFEAHGAQAANDTLAQAAMPKPQMRLSDGQFTKLSAPAAPSNEGSLSCVEARKEVLYNNYGYDHWVHLTSRCEFAVTCQVSSDSNPSGNSVKLGAGQAESSLLFRGSPASEFTAKLSCARDR